MRWICIAFVFGVACLPAGAGTVGEKLEVPSLKDIRYAVHTFESFKDAQVIALYFTSSEAAQFDRDLVTLREIAAAFDGKPVKLLIVNAGANDSIMDMAYHALSHDAPFPVMKDESGAFAAAVGVTLLGEAAVIDRDRILRYRGGVLGLRAAIDAALRGETTKTSAPVADGVSIASGATVDAIAKFTFAEHVAPIVYNKCAGCHRPGTGAPFSLLNYEQVSARAGTIARVVGEGSMPPWFAHPKHGKSTNNGTLTPSEKAALISWAKNGREAGDLSKALEPPALPDAKWAIGEPDMFIQAESPQKLPATGYIPYVYVKLPYIFPHDTWVQGIQIMPSNPDVVHHANLIFLRDGEKYSQATNFLTGKVPGGSPANLRDNTALMIPQGAQLVLQVHYVTTGKEEQDRIGVGLRFAKEPIHKRVRYKIIHNKKFAIPPHAAAHRVTAEDTLECDATLLAMFSHMHLRGRDMTFIAHKPAAGPETLLVIPNYDFDWQLTYYYPHNAMKLPKDTRLEVIAHYDNSALNTFNPDPSATVEDGPQTFEEMMYGFVFYTDDAEHLNIRVDAATGKAIETVANAE